MFTAFCFLLAPVPLCETATSSLAVYRLLANQAIFVARFSRRFSMEKREGRVPPRGSGRSVLPKPGKLKTSPLRR